MSCRYSTGGKPSLEVFAPDLTLRPALTYRIFEENPFSPKPGELPYSLATSWTLKYSVVLGGIVRLLIDAHLATLGPGATTCRGQILCEKIAIFVLQNAGAVSYKTPVLFGLLNQRVSPRECRMLTQSRAQHTCRFTRLLSAPTHIRAAVGYNSRLPGLSNFPFHSSWWDAAVVDRNFGVRRPNVP